MIDLIDECGEDLSINKYTVIEDKHYGIKLGMLSIENKKEEKITGFDKGDYVILSSPLTHFLDRECHDYLSNILAKNLKKMMQNQGIKRGQRVLVAGLGNPDILSDALGKKTIDKISSNTYNKNNHIFKFVPNVFITTGIDTFDMIHMLAVWLGVDYVILIDSLATTNIQRLGISIQLNSAGITPGSAIHHNGKKISKDTLGIPCFAIGVPLMFLPEKIIDNCPENLVLTLKDIHENLDTLAYIISNAINKTI